MSRSIRACLLIFALTACKGETPQLPLERSAPELRVTVETVQMTKMTPTITLSGQLVARETVRIFPEVDGLIIQRVVVEAGDTVRAGQPLLLVDTKPAQLELEQAKAQRAQAFADFQRLRQELTRMRSVAHIGGVSDNVLTSSELQLQAAEEQLRAATAARDIAEHRLSKALFRAPFASIVLQRDVEVGDRTGTSNAPYFVLARDGDIEFEAFGATRQLEAIEPGMPAQVRAEGRAPQLGFVRAAAVAVDSNTRNGRVRIQFNAAPSGSSGAPATATIQLPSRQALSIPASALRFNPTPWVWLVNPNGTTRRQNLELGVANAERYEVRAGLHAGDRFVSDAGALLVEGDRITPVEATSAQRSQSTTSERRP